MSKTISARYLKMDIYGGLCFITNEELDKKGYDDLLEIEKKLGEIVPGSYLPVYSAKSAASKYVSFKCEKPDGPPFKKNAIYELTINFKTRAKQDKSKRYAVINIIKKRFVKDYHDEENLDI